MTFKPITSWSKYNRKTKQWRHNHIEDGHITKDFPTGTSEQTEAWKSGLWTQYYEYMDSNRVVHTSLPI